MKCKCCGDYPLANLYFCEDCDSVLYVLRNLDNNTMRAKLHAILARVSRGVDD